MLNLKKKSLISKQFLLGKELIIILNYENNSYVNLKALWQLMKYKTCCEF